MSVTIKHSATVYCEGAYHYPLELALLTGSKVEANAKIRAHGWLITSDGRTYCPQHRTVENRVRHT